MRRLATVGIVIVLLLGSLVVTSCAMFGRKETLVTITQVPPPSIEKIESGGKVTYEVEYMKDGKELDAYFTEDGPVKGAQ